MRGEKPYADDSLGLYSQKPQNICAGTIQFRNDKKPYEIMALNEIELDAVGTNNRGLKPKAEWRSISHTIYIVLYVINIVQD